MASLLTIFALFTQYRQIKQDTFLRMKIYAACNEIIHIYPDVPTDLKLFLFLAYTTSRANYYIEWLLSRSTHFQSLA
jgi:hypothetical protein